MVAVKAKCDGPVKMFLYFPGEEPELLGSAQDVIEAGVIATAFSEAESHDPTGGRLFIEVHQKCTKSLRSA